MIKNPLANSGDSRDEGSIPVLGRSPGVNGISLQYPWGRKESSKTEHTHTELFRSIHKILFKLNRGYGLYNKQILYTLWVEVCLGDQDGWQHLRSLREVLNLRLHLRPCILTEFAF